MSIGFYIFVIIVLLVAFVWLAGINLNQCMKTDAERAKYKALLGQYEVRGQRITNLLDGNNHTEKNLMEAARYISEKVSQVSAHRKKGIRDRWTYADMEQMLSLSDKLYHTQHTAHLTNYPVKDVL